MHNTMCDMCLSLWTGKVYGLSLSTCVTECGVICCRVEQLAINLASEGLRRLCNVYDVAASRGKLD